MLTLSDKSYIEERKIEKEKVITIDKLTQNVTHNLIAPLQSISLLALGLESKVENNSHKKECKLVYSTS